MRNLLLEMAVYSENDVFKMNPVASVSTKVTDELEGNELRKYVLQNFQSVEIKPNYKIDEHIVGELISHHCGHRHRKKAALLALPYVINANFVTAPWRRRLGDDGQPVRKNDKRPSGMICAPILIDGIKCLCCLTLRKSKGIITPYSLVLKDENGEIIEGEKMEGTISSVPHSSSEPTAVGDAHPFKATISHDTNPSFQDAKIQQNIETNNNNDIKTENIRMNKKQIRLTESDLKQIVKESVNKILSEAYGTPRKLDKGLNDKIDSYLQYDHTYDPEKDTVWDNRKLYGNNGVSYKTTDNKNSSKPFVSNHTYSIDGVDIVPELDALYKEKHRISTTIYNACTKVGCKPDMFDEIPDSTPQDSINNCPYFVLLPPDGIKVSHNIRFAVLGSHHTHDHHRRSRPTASLCRPMEPSGLPVDATWACRNHTMSGQG